MNTCVTLQKSSYTFLFSNSTTQWTLFQYVVVVSPLSLRSIPVKRKLPWYAIAPQIIKDISSCCLVKNSDFLRKSCQYVLSPSGPTRLNFFLSLNLTLFQLVLFHSCCASAHSMRILLWHWSKCDAFRSFIKAVCMGIRVAPLEYLSVWHSDSIRFSLQ